MRNTTDRLNSNQATAIFELGPLSGRNLPGEKALGGPPWRLATGRSLNCRNRGCGRVAGPRYVKLPR